MNYLKSLSMIALVAILAVSCKSPNKSVKVTGVSLNKSTLSLVVSTSEQLTATVSPSDTADKSVTWASSNPAVATVENGNVSAIAIGEATITVTTKDGGKTATCAVTVTIRDPLTYDEGVVINGVKWATRNVDAVGTFAATPESAGMFYQWNRKIGWSSTDPMVNSNGGTEWDSSTPEGTEWTAANDPSPAGWRVPTFDELQTLLDTAKVLNEWMPIINGVDCILFIDKQNDNTLLLPAAGLRDYSDGTLYYVGTFGNYWGSTQDVSARAYDLYFDYVHDADWHSGNRRYGFCVRPVSK